MKLIIAAIGRLKKGPEQELVTRYFDRTKKSGKAIGLTNVEAIEIPESRASQAQQRKLEEAQSLKQRLPEGCKLILFDERGKTPDSRTFAQNLSKNLESGTRSIAFIIGGPDGFDAEFRKSADQVISFGALTMPHQLARIVILEQIYRATTILTNHPYHRD